MTPAIWAEVEIRDLPGGCFGIVIGHHVIRKFASEVMAKSFLESCEAPKLREIGPLLDGVLAHDEVKQIPPLSDHPCGALVDYLRAARRAWLELVEANGSG